MLQAVSYTGKLAAAVVACVDLCLQSFAGAERVYEVLGMKYCTTTIVLKEPLLARGSPSLLPR